MLDLFEKASNDIVVNFNLPNVLASDSWSLFDYFLTVASVQFVNDQYYVNKTESSVRVAVILTGTVDQSVTVRYEIL